MTGKQKEQHTLAVAIFYNSKNLRKVVAKIGNIVNKEYAAGTIRKRARDSICKAVFEIALDLDVIKRQADELASVLRE